VALVVPCVEGCIDPSAEINREFKLRFPYIGLMLPQFPKYFSDNALGHSVFVAGHASSITWHANLYCEGKGLHMYMFDIHE